MRGANWMRILSLVLPLAGCNDGPTEHNSVVRQFDALDDAEWSTPVHLGAVNSSAGEQNPALSKDELSLYFASNRPGGLGGMDIWVSRRESRESPWGAAVNLGAPINTPGAEAAPSLSHDGHLLFFHSDRTGSAGGTDIYVARRTHTNDDLGWREPTALGPDVNTVFNDQAPKYAQNSEEGSANLYFNRSPTLSGGDQDIFYAPIKADGETRGPAVFVAELSAAAPANEGNVAIRHDGRELFFFSNRPGPPLASDLYVSTRANVHVPWSAPVKLGSLNTPSIDTQPTLSFDGLTMIFSSNRPGGLGANDLWMTTRSRKGN